MTVWEILLLIAGFACVCLSFFVARGREAAQPDDAETQGTSDVWTEKEEQMIRERVTQLVEERQNELLEAAQDQMNHLCNDKIMAIDEFSQQLLEKIESNHREVVFMYNMLTEKEKEIKKVITAPVVREAKAGQEEKSAVKKPAGKPASAPAVKKPAVSEQPEAPVRPAALSPAASPKPAPAAVPKQVQSAAVKPAASPKPEAVKQSAVSPNPTVPSERIEPVVEPVAMPAVEPAGQETVSVKNVSGDINLRIQKMYREGKSILEISKELDIGQGEVQLVIALYGGRRR